MKVLMVVIPVLSDWITVQFVKVICRKLCGKRPEAVIIACQVNVGTKANVVVQHIKDIYINDCSPLS